MPLATAELYVAAATEVVLKHRVQNIELPYRRVTPGEKDVAAAEAAKFKDDPQQRWNYRWNQRVVDRFEAQASETQPPYVMELYALRLGDVAIATDDFELSTDYGVQIKAGSPGIQKFVIRLAGPGGYLSTARAARHGGYGAVIQSSGIGPEGGQVLVDRTVDTLRSRWATRYDPSLHCGNAHRLFKRPTLTEGFRFSEQLVC